MSDASAATNETVAPRGIAFDEWKLEILGCRDVDEVMRVIRAYLIGWKPEELSALPKDIASSAIESSDDLMVRALTASRAEVFFNPNARSYLLREMALTLAAAATRIRMLRATHNIKL